MEATATVSGDWWLGGSLAGWRRTTGILRAHLAALPLSAWVSPEDAERLVTLGELARYRDASMRAEIGYWGKRAPVVIELTRWLPTGQACITVRALRARPVSAWWLPWSEFAGCPPTPHRSSE